MKVPKLGQLRRLNKQIRTRKEVIYLRVLKRALVRYARITGDSRGLGYFRSRSFHLLLTWADSLVEQKYSTAVLHFAASQIAGLIRKYPWDPSIVKTTPEETAIATFKASEHRCKRMNQWFRSLKRTSKQRGEIHGLLQRMRDWIRFVINDEPDLPEIYAMTDFTGGASIGVHGNATNLLRKLSVEKWSCTPTALPFFAAALLHNYHYAQRIYAEMGTLSGPLSSFETGVMGNCELVSYNKVAFVPKTAKTLRSIAVEPLGNGFVQKGVDLYMRRELFRIGLDLSDQSLNQELARQGSVQEGEDTFCTLDLKSASDSISIGLVRELLPPDWVSFLDRVRSPSYVLNGQEHRSEKFCTMGNGFCFPLETLIFAAACHAVKAGIPRRDFIVYGDDIIVRRKVFDDVVSLLKRIGFLPNSRKTFSEGPFRESCGGNWYKGKDVTPFTLDFELDNLSSLFKFVNLARRNDLTASFLEGGILAVLAEIPDDFRFHRPFVGVVDTGIDPLGFEYGLAWGRHHSWQTLAWPELEIRPLEDELQGPSWVVMAAALRGHPSKQMFTLRRKTRTRVQVIARSGDIESSLRSPPEKGVFSRTGRH